MSDKQHQLEQFRVMLQDLNEIKKEVEQNKKTTLHTLARDSIDERIAGFAIGGYIGVSEFFYEKGIGSTVDWMIGVQLLSGTLNYAYERLYIFSKDEIKTFDTKEKFIEFLREKQLLKTEEK